MRLLPASTCGRLLVKRSQASRSDAIFLLFAATVCVLSVGNASPAGAAKTPVKPSAKPAKPLPSATTIAGSPASSGAAVVSAASIVGSNSLKPAPIPAAKPTTDLKGDIEAKIASVQREAAPGLKVGGVSCPATLAGKKTKVPIGNYSCTITIEGVPAPYTVIVKEGGSLKGGVFQISPTKAIIDVSKIVSFVKTSLDPADAASAKISCGNAPVVVADPGAPITCTLTRGKAVEKLEFEVRNVNGLVALKTGAKAATPSTIVPVAAPSSTPAASPTTVAPKTVAPKA
jgi:hypothetical protein